MEKQKALQYFDVFVEGISSQLISRARKIQHLVLAHEVQNLYKSQEQYIYSIDICSESNRTNTVSGL